MFYCYKKHRQCCVCCGKLFFILFVCVRMTLWLGCLVIVKSTIASLWMIFGFDNCCYCCWWWLLWHFNGSNKQFQQLLQPTTATSSQFTFYYLNIPHCLVFLIPPESQYRTTKTVKNSFISMILHQQHTSIRDLRQAV